MKQKFVFLLLQTKVNTKKDTNICVKLQGGKPSGTIKNNRPEGGKPCTVRILEELEKQGEMTRKNLRKIICDEGYQMKTFRNTINYLKRQQRISVVGEGTSPNQKIKKL